MKKIYLLLLLAVICQNASSQIYYEDIKYEGGMLLSKLPRGYKFHIKGPVPSNIDKVEITIAGAPTTYKWYRTNANETTFTVFVSNPIPTGTVTYSIDFLEIAPAAAGVMPAAAVPAIVFALPANTATQAGSDTEPTTDNVSAFEPVIGMGTSLIGRKPSTSYDFIGYAAIRFHFVPVDKSRRYSTEKVYQKRMQRLCVIVGGITTPVSYKSQLLGNPFLNMKPMVGVSMDITPDLSIDTGIFGFDYLNTDASLKSVNEAKFKTGFFVGLSMTADAFNRLKSLLNNEQYNKTTNE